MGHLLLAFSLLLSFLTEAKVILIDPGHGGDEVGAVGLLDSKTKIKIFEKDLSLKLALKVKEHLGKQAITYLTRSLDRTVTLQERADLADLIKADLFISIHFNSSVNTKSRGFEIYFLDNNSNAAAQKVEKAENLNLHGEELVVNQILIDLVVQQTISYSKKLASSVHQHLKPVLGKYRLDDRGIKPGLFYVLALSKRPGILIEAGFMSNMDELKKINQEKYLDDIAKSISAGILEYIRI